MIAEWQTWFTVVVVASMVVCLVKEFFTPDVTLGSALALLLASGVLTPKEALSGFANEGLLTIAALFVVAQAVQDSGAMTAAAFYLLGKVKSRTAALIRLMLPTTAVSAFMNNTPVVAMFIPIVRTWAIRNDISPSKLLIPLSYASILGGMCTLIGTSTNLVVSGMMADHGFDSMGMFEISAAGMAVAAVGLLFMLTIGQRLLPSRADMTERMEEERREYLVEMVVKKNCRLIGKSIEDGGLRHLKGLFLVHIERGGKVIGPVPPNEILLAEDRLRFTGLTSTIVELKAIRGLSPVSDADLEFPSEKTDGELRLFEVVVATSSPLVGLNIREASFRTRYDAAVIAVHRAGQRIQKKIGDIILKPGDTLLLEAPEDFAFRWYNTTHFYLVSKVGRVKRIKHERAPFVLLVIAAMVALPAFGVIPMIASAVAAAAVFILTKVITPATAKRAVDLSVLVVIASALGIGHAIEKTGLATLAATALVDAASGLGPLFVLGVVLALTNIFTELVTNKAAAALFFPIALEAARIMDTDPRPFMLGVALAAAASFATPLGYQTNLIVYGPGGYRFTDFLKVGVLMNVLSVVTATVALWYLVGS